jgi:hypothetical protein
MDNDPAAAGYRVDELSLDDLAVPNDLFVVPDAPG